MEAAKEQYRRHGAEAKVLTSVSKMEELLKIN